MKARNIAALLALVGALAAPMACYAQTRNSQEIKAEIDKTDAKLKALYQEFQEAIEAEQNAALRQVPGQQSIAVGIVTQEEDDEAVISDQNYEADYNKLCKDLAGNNPKKAISDLIQLGNIYPKAWFKVGDTYRNGIKGKIPMDMKEAIKYFTMAAKSGDSEAMSSLATIYLTGENGVDQNPTEGQRYLLDAANAGDVIAMSNLGYAYQNGKFGFDRNLKEAVRWTRAAANEGEVNARYSMYELYNVKAPGVSFKEAKDNLEKIIKQDPNNKKALAALGKFYLDDRKTQGTGLEYLRKAAGLGSVEAMDILAEYLKFSNPEEAAKWRKQSEQLKKQKIGTSLSDSLSENLQDGQTQSEIIHQLKKVPNPTKLKKAAKKKK